MHPKMGTCKGLLWAVPPCGFTQFTASRADYVALIVLSLTRQGGGRKGGKPLHRFIN